MAGTFSFTDFSSSTFSTDDEGGDTHDWAGYGTIKRVKDREIEDVRKIERAEIRRMLEAAFSDAPRDPVVVKAKREHPVASDEGESSPRVDWSSLLADLNACQVILGRYASRIDQGRTQTQRGDGAREELQYSAESIMDALETLRAEAAAKRARMRRAAIAMLMN